MYLKSIEMIGFKSFADKTKLEFEPGLTAIVGPNGCGKSNISDAFRWVLGEQSAKALRGSRMEDCIFNGTDNRKPLGMAEVSVTFAHCEGILGTEYHEVAVTRRVFRSGEGQYFLNRTPCRLKDIQRLFMDTGIGTDSYSLMEQGRIDQVLSAHPEDRRAIFEEASGITKFKADKKEAIRKLEQTEANLLRLADVIREVKRQIGSLQRQAGKARRYKEIQEELRKLDLHATQLRAKAADAAIAQFEAELAALREKAAAAHAEVDELEQGNAVLRESLVQTERAIGAVMESGSQAQSRLDHARELIQVNRQRIEEYRVLRERDTKESAQTETLLADKRRALDEAARHRAQAAAEQAQAEETLRASNARLEAHLQTTEAVRAEIQKRRGESVDLESLHVHLQNDLVQIESRERARVVQRERLAAEKGQYSRLVANYEQRETEMAAAAEELQRQATAAEQALQQREAQRADAEDTLRALEQKLAETRAAGAACRARIALLSETEEAQNDLPAGARWILDPASDLGASRAGVLGTLADCLHAEPGYASALEAALRPWLDAVVVADAAAALDILRRLEAARRGAARLLAAAGHTAPPPRARADGDRLASHLRCPEPCRPLVERLLGNVVVLENLDALPGGLAPDRVYVTRSGALVRADGCLELWMQAHLPADPLSRRHRLAEARAEQTGQEQTAARQESERAALLEQLHGRAPALDDARRRVAEARQALAQKQGESRIVSREGADARQRLETVTWELENLEQQGTARDGERQAIGTRMGEVQTRREQAAAAVQERTRELHALESAQAALQAEVTEDRIRLASVAQRCEHLGLQHEALQTRIAEMVASLEARAEALRSYEANMQKLQAAIDAAEAQLSSMEEAVAASQAKTGNLRRNRERQAQELEEMEQLLAQRRAALDELRDSRAALDLKCSEAKLRRQSQIERAMADYHMSAEQVLQAPEPVWEGEPPSMETLETLVAEHRAKLEAMGPVNLIAIEEYNELEERYAFLTGQEQDLIRSKQQLMDMIRKINRTTSEMFHSTFERVNANFQAMFTKLFDGGTARLVLVDEEDVLESGIEIIARPPGKRLQNVSLLSGGERTLTAVALLFSIYLIKPSPFCLLDELDAALDESNIGRFIRVLQDFLRQSQFMVITHNRQTIAAADILYGVTMPEKGISKIMSMRFKDRPAAPPPPAAEAPQPQAEAPVASPAPAP